MKLASEVLTAAADLIEPPGAWWCGNPVTRRPRESLCMVMAIAKVYMKGAPDWDDLLGWVRQGVDVPGAGSVPAWNDTHTQAECVAAMRRAAELAKEAGQ